MWVSAPGDGALMMPPVSRASDNAAHHVPDCSLYQAEVPGYWLRRTTNCISAELLPPDAVGKGPPRDRHPTSAHSQRASASPAIPQAADSASTSSRPRPLSRYAT